MYKLYVSGKFAAAYDTPLEALYQALDFQTSVVTKDGELFFERCLERNLPFYTWMIEYVRPEGLDMWKDHWRLHTEKFVRKTLKRVSGLRPIWVCDIPCYMSDLYVYTPTGTVYNLQGRFAVMLES